MVFDVRFPIGLLFLAIGALVASYGLSADPVILEAHSAGVNIDLIWGSTMALFGMLMLVLAGLAKRRGGPPQG